LDTYKPDIMIIQIGTPRTKIGLQTLIKLTLVSALIYFGTNQAIAFQLQPCLRMLTINHKTGALGEKALRTTGLTCRFGKLINVDPHSVHEHLTWFSIALYQRQNVDTLTETLNYISPDSGWTSSKTRSRKAVIMGSWWNDDPLMYLWGGGKDFRHGVSKLGKAMEQHTWYEPKLDMKPCISHENFLPQLSHFGNFQFLHFMTNETIDTSNRLASTQRKALSWMKLAYLVAVGSIDPDTSLSNELITQYVPEISDLNLPTITEKNLCLQNPTSKKIRSLFAQPGLDTTVRNERTPDIAAGSMLHIIQDSFSPAHTKREPEVINGKKYYVLHDVFNYNEQSDKKAHSNLDDYPAWLISYAKTGAHEFANNPIIVGACLLEAIDRKSHWEAVEEYLLDTAFLSEDRVKTIQLNKQDVATNVSTICPSLEPVLK
jgi:hypothetical protein